LFAVAAALPQFWPPLNADVAAILQFAERMWAGERLYVDLFDINPPMAFWSSLPAVALADLTGLPAPVAFVGTVVAATLGLGAWAWWLAPRATGTDGLPVAALAPLLAVFCLVFYPRGAFGQREHLLALLVLPYLVVAVARAGGDAMPGPSARIGVAAVAMIGIVLKPHFALLPLAIEAAVLIRRGWRPSAVAPELATMATLGSACVAMTAVLHPAYFELVLPLVARHYHAFDLDLLPALAMGEQLPGLALALACLVPVVARRRSAPVVVVLTAAAVGATLAAAAQLKDWEYHFLPARAAVIGAVAMFAADLLGRWLRPEALTLARATIAARIAVVAIAFLSGALTPPFRAQLWYQATRFNAYAELVKANASGQPVLWLVQDVTPFPALNYAEARQAMRFMCLWLLPAFYEADRAAGSMMRYHEPERMTADERWLFDAVANDFARSRPALVLAVAGPDAGFAGTAFDYVAYFRRHPVFAAAWADYVYIGRVRDMNVWRRVSPADQEAGPLTQPTPSHG
jgi:hypothetical protein